MYTVANERTPSRTQTFTYDSLNRIATAQSSGTQWGEAYTIDAWSNLTTIGQVSGQTYHESLSQSALPNNQLTGFTYDASGNMIANGSSTYFYDAENRLVATAGTSYIYDGDGNRVEKCTEGSTPGLCASGATGTMYWRGTSADPQAETDLSGNVLENYIFFNGQRIARRDGSTKAVHFYFSDHLGTHGVVVNSTGSTCEQDIDYYPYSGQENDYCPNVAQHYKFTGKERDSESGLDNFGARYNASSMGRFMSPDAKMPSVRHLVNPQKWNKYAYTINNPLRYFDPDGMEEKEVQLRAYIQAKSVSDPAGRTFAGDNRGATSAQNVTSRTSITVRIETDPSIRPGNPIISQTSSAGTTKQVDANGNVVNSATATQGLPTATGSRDANGNPVLNIQQDAKNPLEPQSLTPGISSNLNVTVGGSSVTTAGTVSGTPSFELNVSTAGGADVNVPLQTEPSGMSFGLGLFQTNSILNVTPLPPTPPPCAQNKGSGCNQ